MAYLCSQTSKNISRYPLWRWFFRSSLQHRVSWVGIRWRIIDVFVFKVLHLHWGAPSCQSTVHDISRPVSLFHVHVSNRFSTTCDTRCLIQIIHFFLFFFKNLHSDTSCSSVQIWFQMFVPNTVTEIINKSQEDCKSINLQINDFLSTC